MKKILIMCISSLFIFSVVGVFAGGQEDANSTQQKIEEKMIIRVAEQVPNLITPGVWDGQAFSLNASIYDYLIEMDAATG
ncbi:MAG: hypothetical protein HQ557_07290, partial [Bacteroidetes bacterium]|nr:hypothetical protein [Bacteroidota bacterium]